MNILAVNGFSRLMGPGLAMLLLFAGTELAKAQDDPRIKRAGELIVEKKREDAIRLYIEVSDDPKVSDVQRLYGLMRAGSSYQDVWELNQARKLYLDGLERFPAGKNTVLDRTILGVRLKLAALEFSAGQSEKAIESLKKLLADSQNNADSYQILLVSTTLTGQLGNYELMLEHGRKLIYLTPNYWKAGTTAIRQAAAQLCCNDQNDKLLRETLVDLYRCEASADNSGTIEAVKGAIIQLELLLGEFEKAQYDAFVLTEMASSKASLEDGVKLLLTATKAVDGHMARANQYLAYQNARASVKPGEPVPVNPLRGLAPNIAPERIKVYEEKINKVTKTDWIGRLERARIMQAMGKSSDALAELDQAYKECPVDKYAMQRVIDQTVDLLIQISADPAVGQKLVDYLRFGESGPDTKVGTTDDLVDPRTPYMPKK